MRKKNHQSRIVYSVKFSFKSERNKDFDRQTNIEGISFQICLTRNVELIREGKLYRSETQLFIKKGRASEKE